MTTETEPTLIDVTKSTRKALSGAVADLDSWPDAIADSDPGAYARHLLGVLGGSHGHIDAQRRTAAVRAVTDGVLSIRQAAAALGVTPATVLRWRDGR